MDQSIEVLLAMIDEAFDRKSWHGTNLRGSIRGLSAHDVVWRPGKERRNAWELVVHAAYWKYTVRRRLQGEKRGSFPLKGSNFFERSDPDEALWKSDVDLLVSTHRSLRDAIAKLSASDLRKNVEGGKVTVQTLITGIAAHDLYHAGQIQLLKRLRP